jgi:hypothetical protein
MFSNLKAICTMERVKSTPSFKFIDRKHLKWLIGPSSDYDVLVAIVSRVSVTRTELLRLSGKTAAELDVITDRLVASGRIERNLRRSTGGRRAGEYCVPHHPSFWGICTADAKRLEAQREMA